MRAWFRKMRTMHPLLARVIVTAIAAGQGLGPLLIDLNRTHATHPQWPGHARFHVVWQAFTLFLGSGIALALIWIPGTVAEARFYLAALLTAIPLIGFAIALVGRRLYGGTLHDPDGIAPVRIGRIMVDMNTVLVAAAAVMLVIATNLY